MARLKKSVPGRRKGEVGEIPGMGIKKKTPIKSVLWGRGKTSKLSLPDYRLASRTQGREDGFGPD